jgi:bacterioferritin-associated ferredoxin
MTLTTKITSGVSRLTDKLPGRMRSFGDPARRAAIESQAGYVCHCKRVAYGTVDREIRRGARSIADLQRRTTACTRCFGCRFELERMLKAQWGERYAGEAGISLPVEFAGTRLPRPMYMPVLAGLGGYEVDTRVIVFNHDGPAEPVRFRADLLRLDGERVDASNHVVPDGHSAILDYSREAVGALLPDGAGVVKLILDVDEVGSLRPYFHFQTPTCVTSTHEKKGPIDPQRRKERGYHWIFPIGRSPVHEEAYFFATNTQTQPMEGQRLVFKTDEGEEQVAEVPELAFDQTMCLPLHEHFPGLHDGSAHGAVRLEPPLHVVAGFMIRHEPEAQLWRVQHL